LVVNGHAAKYERGMVHAPYHIKNATKWKFNFLVIFSFMILGHNAWFSIFKVLLET